MCIVNALMNLLFCTTMCTVCCSLSNPVTMTMTKKMATSKISAIFVVLCILNIAYGRRSKVKISLDYNIFGGTAAQRKEFPHVVFIVLEEFKCSGTLLTREWVLTASHCFFSMKKRDKAGLRVYGGVLVRGDIETGSQVRAVEKVYGYPSVLAHWTLYDVALLKLVKPFEMTADVNYTRIATGRFPRRGEICTSLGFMTYPGSFSVGEALKWVDLMVVDHVSCKKKFMYTEHLRNAATKLCAVGDQMYGFCFGDSGGPLMCQGVQVAVHHGMVAVNNHGPSVYGICNPDDMMLTFIYTGDVEWWLRRTISDLPPSVLLIGSATRGLIRLSIMIPFIIVLPLL